MGTKAQIGKNIRRIRLKAKLTQVEVAKKAGIHVNYLARIERGEHNPSTDVIESIAKALKVRSSDILPF